MKKHDRATTRIWKECQVISCQPNPSVFLSQIRTFVSDPDSVRSWQAVPVILGSLGEVDYVSKGYQMLPHSLTEKTKTVHFHLPFTRLCSCGCFSVCRHRPICMALESVVGQNILIQQRPTRGLFQTLNEHHRYSTIPTGRHCGLGPDCAR